MKWVSTPRSMRPRKLNDRLQKRSRTVIKRFVNFPTMSAENAASGPRLRAAIAKSVRNLKIRAATIGAPRSDALADRDHHARPALRQQPPHALVEDARCGVVEVEAPAVAEL